MDSRSALVSTRAWWSSSSSTATMLITGAASRTGGWTRAMVALLLVEALSAFGVGMWMGAVSEQVRTGAVGSLLWVLLIAARVGVGGVFTHRYGAEIIASGSAAH